MEIQKYASVTTILLLAFLLVVNSQFKVYELYSYDAYFHTGISNIIVNTGNVVYDTIPHPYAVSSTVVNIGYVPMPPILQAIISMLTDTSLFISAKIYVIAVYIPLVLSVFILSYKLTRSLGGAIASAFVFIYTPIIFYRTSYIVGEPAALLFWLLILNNMLNKNYQKFLIVLLSVSALAFHPRSAIFYLAIVAILYILITFEKERKLLKFNFNKINIAYVLLTFILALPFLKLLVVLNLLLWIQKGGAMYVLYPPTAVKPITFELISNQVGESVFLISFLGILSLVSNLKKVEHQFIAIWLIFGWMLLFIGYHLSFPTNRLTIHLGIVLSLLCGFVLFIFKSVNKNTIKLGTCFMVFVLVVAVVHSFYKSTYHNPYLGWGPKEREAMNFLSNYLSEIVDNDYVIFTPEFGMAFGYGIKNIEFNESLIAKVLRESYKEEELISKLESIYPKKHHVFIIVGRCSEQILSHRYPILKKLSENNIIYKNPRVKIYHYTLNK